MPRYEGFEEVAVSTSSVPLVEAVTALARHAHITVEDASIRYKLSGEAPTASEGHPADAGAVITLQSGDEVARFRAIRSGGADAALSVSYGA